VRKILFGAIGAGVIAAGYFGGVALGILPGGTPDEAEISAYLQSTMDAVNNDTDYSGAIDGKLRIDDWTDITHPSIDGKTISFDMVSVLKLDQITAGGRSIDSYMPSRRYAAKKHVCDIADASRMLAAGVVFHYTLISYDGETYGEVTADKGFCD
jgi:hypothetical protein